MVWNTRLVWPGGRWVSPPRCAPSWILVKINPVLAKPRTPLKIHLTRVLLKKDLFLVYLMAEVPNFLNQ